MATHRRPRDPLAAGIRSLAGRGEYLVALARDAGAEALVSGDKDLLDHPGLEPVAIDAREACELLGLLD